MKKGFTLVELLAVIVILGVIFMFIVPRLSTLIKNGETKEKEVLEAKIINAGKEYVSSYNRNLYDNLIDVGDYNYVCLNDLLDNKLIDESDLNGLDEISGIKIELQEKDKVDYTIEYGDSSVCDNSSINLIVELNGGTISSNIEGEYDSNSVIDLPIPTKENATFNKWIITKGSGRIEGNVLKTGYTNITISAVWKTSIVLTVDKNGGSSSQTFNTNYNTGEIIELLDLKKAGHEFTGWEVVNGNSILSGKRITIGSTDTTINGTFNECSLGTYNDGSSATCTPCENSDGVATWSNDRTKCEILTCEDVYELVDNECKVNLDPEEWTTPGSYTYTIPVTGYYKLETWGAKGGTGYANGNAMAGGNGGYTSGEIYLTQGTTLYIYTGGIGNNGNPSSGVGGTGGYNGGAKGGDDTLEKNDPAGGGGGATDIRLVTGAWNDVTSLNSRIIVAGGGGGGTFNYTGGVGNLDADNVNSSNVLGIGETGYPNTGSGSGGGGGGYYGGKSENGDSGKGYGGTYFISPDFTNVSVVNGINSGAGKAVISYVGHNPSIPSINNWTVSTPGYHTYKVPQTGYYKLETWGAKGGTGYGDGNATSGGNGGYTAGEIYLTEGTTLYIYTGGIGGNGNPNNASGAGGRGGYNGGAYGGFDSVGGDAANDDPAGGGGGATDIRYFGDITPTSDQLHWNSELGLASRIIVAGGGGGGTFSNIGGAGNFNADNVNSSNALGIGQAGCHNTASGSGGGGGGYYGGKTECQDNGRGYGGTYYVSSDFVNYSVLIGNNSTTGKATISYIGDNPSDPSDVTWTTVNSSYHTYKVSATGYYKIEAWGAKGGNGYANGNATSGGNGGYTTGEIYLTQGTILYIYLGGIGGNGNPSSGAGGTGGFNGGASGGQDTNDKNDPAGGGGGSTDIRYFGDHVPSEAELKWNSELGLASRILVAGGGGGGTFSNIGGAGNLNADTVNSSNVLGIGQTGCPNSGSGSGGGGGGYYGGKTECQDNGKGYGGTYYISTNFVNTTITAGVQSGNGKAAITWHGVNAP